MDNIRRDTARMTPATSVILPEDDMDAPGRTALVVREVRPGVLLLTLPGNIPLERPADCLVIAEDYP
jgi:hypothetical protein